MKTNQQPVTKQALVVSTRGREKCWTCKTKGWVPHPKLELQAAQFPLGTKVTVTYPLGAKT